MEDINILISIILGIYFIYCQDKMMFYRTNEQMCKKAKGNCKNCSCWSCVRADYINKKGELKDDK